MRLMNRAIDCKRVTEPFALVFEIVAMFIFCLVGHAAEMDLSKLPPVPSRPVNFEKDIRPIFQASCVPCHGPEKQKGGFRLDLKAAALKGGDDYAPAIVPGKSA